MNFDITHSLQNTQEIFAEWVNASHMSVSD